MKSKLRLCAISILALFAMACTPTLIKMYNVHDQPIPHGLTQDQVRKAINIGAGAAGWSTDDVSPGSIIATYKIRVQLLSLVLPS